MAEIVNLRQARKRAARATASAKADANRTAFGLPKALRSAAKAEAAKQKDEHDGRLLSSHASKTIDIAASDDKTAD